MRYSAFNTHVRSIHVIVFFASIYISLGAVSARGQEFLETGSYNGNGEASQAITGLGFQPDVVFIKCHDNKRTVVTTADMGANRTKILADTKSLQSGLILSLDADGFSVGDPDEVNKANTEYYFIALKAGTDQVAIRSYVGDGSFFRSISLTNFRPTAVMVFPAEARTSLFRQIDMDEPSTFSVKLDDSGSVTNGLRTMGNGYFLVGNNDSANEDGKTFYALAFSRQSGTLDSGTYVADGAPGTSITGLGLQPEYVTIFGHNSNPHVHRPASLEGTGSLYYKNRPVTDNLITSLDADGFTVGNNNSVYNNGEDYYWLAMANPLQEADLQVSLGVDNTFPEVGETIDLQVDLKNLGPQSAPDVAVNVVLPTGLTYVSATPEQGTFDADTGVWTVGAMAFDALLGMTLTATVDSGTAGTDLETTATIESASVLDPVPGNNNASRSVSVLAPTGSDLSVTLTVNSDVPVTGQTLTYTMTVTNNGPEAATDIIAELSLPAGVTFDTATPDQGNFFEGWETWDLGDLALDAMATLIVTATVDALQEGQTLTTPASITSLNESDPNSANDSASVSVVPQYANLGLELLATPETAGEGEDITLTLAVTNFGPGNATGIAVDFPLPAGMVFQSASPSQGTYSLITGVWTLGDLDSDQSLYLPVIVQPAGGTAGSDIEINAALIAADQADDTPANDTAQLTVTVDLPDQIDLAMAADLDETAPTVGDIITFTVSLENPESLDAEGVAASFPLPVELSLVNALTNKGTYDETTGAWDIGTLLAGYRAQLSVQARVTEAALGLEVTGTGTITATDQVDPDPANNTASASLIVPTADLALDVSADATTLTVGQQVLLTASVENQGPNGLSSGTIQMTLPAGLTLDSWTADTGTWDPDTGLWNVSGINPAESAELVLTTTVDASAAGSTVTAGALVTSAAPRDPVSANDSDSVVLTIPGTDLELTMVANPTVATPGYEVQFLLTAHNTGTEDASAISCNVALPAGLELDSASPEAGSYTAGDGTWLLPDLAAGAQVTLDLRVLPAPETLDQSLTVSAEITSQTPDDPDAANNTASADILITGASANDVLVWTVNGAGTTVRPGSAGSEIILEMALWNRSGSTRHLDNLTLANLTDTAGTEDQRDGAFADLTLLLDDDEDAAATGAFRSGNALFPDLSWAIPDGDTLRVKVLGSASGTAPDGIRLRAGIAGAAGIGLDGEFTLAGSYPVTSGHSLLVDGFSIAQATVWPLETTLLPIGSEDNLALIVDLPANGYREDSLQGISLVNVGDALPGVDISALRIWTEVTGEGFSPDEDLLLGTSFFTGNRYNLTGLNVPVPVGGRRFYATVSIADTADDVREIQLSLSGATGMAVEMYSGNDGPVDGDLTSPTSLGISVTDRLKVQAEWTPSAVVLPGEDDVILLQALMTNTYAEDKTLRRLNFHNTSTAPGLSDSQRDSMFQQVNLVLDDGDGVLEGPTVDFLLATGNFADLMVSFSGLNQVLPADSATRFFVTADLGLHTVPVDASLSGHLAQAGDLGIAEATIIGSWPLTSGATLQTDGSIAEQITLHSLPVLTLGPAEGPVLAMDLDLPANGPLGDTLEGITFHNAGSAEAQDIALARLWADDGDGIFGGGDGSDHEICALALLGDTWSSPILERELLAAGQRFFVSLTVAASPRDSVTVNLGLPRNGMVVASANDGPLDEEIPGTGTLVISTSPLRTSLSFDADETCVDQVGTLTMKVVNAGSEPVLDIQPTIHFDTGEGLMDLGPPTPGLIASLDPGTSREFTWSTTSTAAGVVALAGNAQGLVGMDQDRFSVITATRDHRVYTPVPELQLYPTANLPFSVNNGQVNLVPFTLTLINPGGSDVADAQLTSLRLRLLESADGPGIVPADLVRQIVVHEGTAVYVSSNDLPTGGDEITLDFDQPAVITGDEPVTLSLRLDLASAPPVGHFLVSIEQADWFTGYNAVNGAAVPVQNPEGSFPVQTGQATLVSPATGLDVAMQNPEPGFAVPGQEDVLLARLDLNQLNAEDGASSIEMGRLGFTLRDAQGLTLSHPDSLLTNLSLVSTYQTHYSAAPVVEGDTLLVLALTSPVTVAGSTTQVLSLWGRIHPDAALGTIVPVLVAGAIDARDGNMNNTVPVTLSTTADGPQLTIVGPAADLQAAGQPFLPTAVSKGTRDLAALAVVLNHPGDITSAPARCDTLTLDFLDASRLALDPAGAIERIDVRAGEELLGTLLDPQDELGRVRVPLSGATVQPGQTLTLEVLLDVASDSPSGGLELTVSMAGIRVRDSYSGQPVTVLSVDGGSSLLSSGLTHIVEVADELRVSAASLMPPLLVPQDEPFPVMSLTLTNPASEGGGGIQLNSLRLDADSAKAASLDFSAALDSVLLMLDGAVAARLTDLGSAGSVLLEPGTPPVVGAGQSLSFTVQAAVRQGAPAGELSFLLSESGIGAGPPGGGGLTISILPVSGEVFPMATQSGHVSASTLADSYANFPNPFAAGREETTFAYALDRQATVRLRILTPHGELVRDLLTDAPRAPGLHQSDLWDGRNGNGTPVHNGVYLAELSVTYDDGSTARQLRKVAVVR